MSATCVALITGGGSGIGRAVAFALAKSRQVGAVVINDFVSVKVTRTPTVSVSFSSLCLLPTPPPHTPTPILVQPTRAFRHQASDGRGERTVAELQLAGVEAVYDGSDVSDRAAVEGMVDRTVEQFGRLDIAVASAYHSVRQPLLEQNWEDVQKTFDTTLFGVYHTLQLSAKAMVDTRDARNRGSSSSETDAEDDEEEAGGPPVAKAAAAHGKLIAIGSVNGPYPYLLPESTPYNCSKAAVETMVANFASTLSAERINVNCVRPGWILTEGESAFCAEDEIRRMADEALPLGIGSPADVAAAVAFLTSDAANYITGITLPVDGGFGVAQRIPGMHQPISRASQR